MYSTLLVLLIGAHAALAARFSACEAWRHHENFHLLNRGGCGRMDFNPRTNSKIVNGEEARPGSLPWMAFVRAIKEVERTEWGSSYSQSSCGGTIINEKYILTAAHCEVTEGLSFVVLGLHNSECLEDRVCEPQAERYNVQRIIPHPQYDAGTLKNDIALIRVDRRISFQSSNINAICLPTSCDIARRTFESDSFVAAGWGKLFGERQATTLQVVKLPMAECTMYSTEYVRNIHPEWTQVCAGNGSVTNCNGDSGGPLVYGTAGRAVQVGITSAGTCKSKSFFTRVAPFIGWILDNIEP